MMYKKNKKKGVEGVYRIPLLPRYIKKELLISFHQLHNKIFSSRSVGTNPNGILDMFLTTSFRLKVQIFIFTDKNQDRSVLLACVDAM